MDAAEVHAVLDALTKAGCRAWVAGGWGVDALVGRQSRSHRDLDLAIDARAESSALAALAQRGYQVETDWRPVRLELAAPGDRWVDLHPVTFDEVGNGTQADLGGGVFVYPADCFVTGTIAGRAVGCLSVRQQFTFHSGYEPRDVDLADLALLRTLTDPSSNESRTAIATPGGMSLAEVLNQLNLGAQQALGEAFVGAYHVGSFALGAGDEASDVDFLVVVRQQPNAQQQEALRKLHARLPDSTNAWAKHLEGSYAPMQELRTPCAPGKPTERWLYVDNGSRTMEWSTHDNSLVTRWIAREHGIVLAGPHPRELIDEVKPAQLSADARDTLATWDADLRRRPDQLVDLWSQQQHVLGLCRLLHRIQHGRILPKVAAGHWFSAFGEDRWHPLIQAAVDGRAQGWQRLQQPVEDFVLKETAAFHHHVVGLATEHTTIY